MRLWVASLRSPLRGALQTARLSLDPEPRLQLLPDVGVPLPRETPFFFHMIVLFLFSICYSIPMSSYEAVRSVTDKSLHVIFNEGTFDALPHRVRSLGPWQGLTGGDIGSLKLHYRLQLAEQGCVVVHQSIASFSAEPLTP
jgi:hypothetical protein